MTESSSKIGHLEDEAFRRKERLKNLKRKREGGPVERDNANKEILPTPQFRSYKPLNDILKEFTLDAAEPADVTTEVKEQLESAKSGIVIDQLDITALAPRKPDWDLKRDVAKKLSKLEKQTQKAIAELIRDRLKENRDSENLAAMVNAGVSSNS